MRPVRLSMTAFGPFAGTETIDFRDATAAGLFGIYGPTGAGKSSIFNAMTFALFGESAKSGQDRSAMRSDHADAGTMTSVTFVFELGAKRYVLHRIPEQDRPKVHGDGFTRQSHEAFLFDATDVAVDDITDDARGKVVAEKKVGLVNAALQDLLGYGATQFRQIVLLPQGEFEAFLTAGTSDRINILRQLFDVSVYRNLEDWFKEEAAKATRAVQEASTKYIGRLEGEGFESVDALNSGIAQAQAVVDEAEKLETEAAIQRANTAAVLKAAETLNADFDLATAATAHAEELAAAKPEFAALAENVERAKAARALQDVADAEARAQRAVSTAQQREAEQSRACDVAKQKSEAAAVRLAALKSKDAEIDALKQRKADLARHQETLAKSVALATEQDMAARAFDKADLALKQAQETLDKTTAARETAHRQRDAARVAGQKRAELETQKAQLQNTLQIAESYEAARAGLTQAQSALTKQESAAKVADADRKQAQITLAKAEQQLAHVQAIHLAERLSDGAPCPVCGSPEHPVPASGEAAGQGLTDAFRKAQTDAKAAEATWQDAANAQAAAQALYDDRSAKLKQLSRPEAEVAALRNGMADLQSALAQLAAIPEATALDAQIAEIDRNIAVATKTRQAAQTRIQEAQTAKALAEQAYRTALAVVPEDVRSATAIDAAIRDVTQEIDQRETALRDAFDLAQTARETAIGAQKEAEAAVQACVDCRTAFSEAQALFDARLKAADMARDSFALHQARIPQIATDEAALDQFRTELAVAEKAKRDAAAKIADKTRPDLTALLLADKEKQAALQAATERKSEARSGCDHLRKLAGSIADEIDRIAQLETETAPLRELSKQFNGQTEARLTLETFAIQAMFDQVLAAANLRLDPMSGGRYRLEIQDENLKGAAKRGLGIQVFDLWTGKPRGTADISGGETFIAALSLALGLSDVVESNAGSIRLDTIFIDEGFGSLDGEDGSGTLDQVLDTLTETAGHRRAVGLISHVGMVKEAIPNGFQIEKTPRGSHVHTRNGDERGA